jgi:hypothetical protein
LTHVGTNPSEATPSELAHYDGVRRASLTLKILAALYAAGIILAGLPGSAPASLLEIVAVNAINLGLALLFVLVALALDRGQRWAAWIIRPLLALLVVYGAYVLITQLMAGLTRIPITMIAAGIALLLPTNEWPPTRLTVKGGVVLVLVAALCVAQIVSRPVFGWGGYLDVHETDLQPRLSVDCGTGAPPDRLVVTYEWSWAKGAPLPNDEDQVVIGWSGDGTDGRPMYTAIGLPAQRDGFYIGISSGASGPMAGEVAANWRGVFLTRLDLHKLEYRPGVIEAELSRTRAQAASMQTLTVGATYIHAGVWRSDAPTVTCTWSGA